jgi:hypothetical protein
MNYMVEGEDVEFVTVNIPENEENKK